MYVNMTALNKQTLIKQTFFLLRRGKVLANLTLCLGEGTLVLGEKASVVMAVSGATGDIETVWETVGTRGGGTG